MTAPSIEVKNLTFAYDQIPILENINFSLLPGEYVGIIGPNGGGKTTLLTLLMGFLKPTKGTISIFGKPPKSAQNLIGWVPQHFNFDKSFPISVLEVVLAGRLSKTRFWGGYLPEDLTVAKEALKKVGMDHFKNAPFSDLSGGQAQRVLIARALASDPKILLLDEPTANVDPDAEREILEILRSLKKEKTILIVTHDLKTVSDEVEKVLCIQKELTFLAPESVCEHFSFGLYHPKRIES